MYHAHIWMPATVMGFTVMRCTICGKTSGTIQSNTPNPGVQTADKPNNEFNLNDNPWS